MTEHEKQGRKPEYNKLLHQKESGTEEGEGTKPPRTEGMRNRDLGTVGGGTLPEPASSLSGTDNPPGGMNISSDTIAGGGTTASSIEGGGSHHERGSGSISESSIRRGHFNEVDAYAQGSIGGRAAGQPQTAMGDRDPRKNEYMKQGGTKPGEQPHQSDIVDPMTSRHPDTLQKDEQ